jgi:3-deoxy-7-phosphoheptulonate synthase
MMLVDERAVTPLLDGKRTAGISPLIPPALLRQEHPLPPSAGPLIDKARTDIANILRGEDDRLVVVVGPCSIHDRHAALDYATTLAKDAERFAGELRIVMRVYFEKPRTTLGWKGLINDPDLDGSFAVNKGLRLARGLLLEITELGLPVGCEFLDPIIPQFLADAVSWGAIGARTAASQVHRQLCSALSMPVGIKNSTEGDVQVAVDGVRAAARPARTTRRPTSPPRWPGCAPWDLPSGCSSTRATATAVRATCARPRRSPRSPTGSPTASAASWV